MPGSTSGAKLTTVDVTGDLVGVQMPKMKKVRTAPAPPEPKANRAGRRLKAALMRWHAALFLLAASLGLIVA